MQTLLESVPVNNTWSLSFPQLLVPAFPTEWFRTLVDLVEKGEKVFRIEFYYSKARCVSILWHTRASHVIH